MDRLKAQASEDEMYKNGKHLQRRGIGGQFERTTLQNTFNLDTFICSHCNHFNPYEIYTYKRDNGFVERIRNEPPERCTNCGHVLGIDHTPVVRAVWTAATTIGD